MPHAQPSEITYQSRADILLIMTSAESLLFTTCPVKEWTQTNRISLIPSIIVMSNNFTFRKPIRNRQFSWMSSPEVFKHIYSLATNKTDNRHIYMMLYLYTPICASYIACVLTSSSACRIKGEFWRVPIYGRLKWVNKMQIVD